MKKSKYQFIPLLLVVLLLLTACGNAAQGAGELPVQSSLFTVSAAQTTPNDQPSSLATAGVERARSLGLVTDEMNQGFQSATTRAEFCRLVSRMLIIFYEVPIDYIIEARGLTPHDFNDTEDYAIRAAAALGITSGTGNGNFSPEQPLTREQAATMLRNVMNVIGLETANHPAIAWTDAGEIASWARDATDVMYAVKIMNGTSSQTLVFSPKTPYSREQAIVTVLNLWNYAQDQSEGDTPPTNSPGTDTISLWPPSTAVPIAGLPLPGERLADRANWGVTELVRHNHDAVEIVIHSSLSVLAQIERYEVIIAGDALEFYGEAVLIYENGHKIYPIHEVFSDGERLVFYVDHSQGAMAEMYTQFRQIAGTMDTRMYIMVIVQDGNRGAGLSSAPEFLVENMRTLAELTQIPLYPKTRQAPAGAGSVWDVIIPHPTSLIPLSTVPVARP